MWMVLFIASALAGSPETAVVKGLLDRHAPTPCAELAPELSEAERLATLIEVAETVEHPAWVPVRAATCVGKWVGDLEPARRAATRWIASSERAGLALAVLRGADGWSEEVAVEVGREALLRGAVSPRFDTYARPLLERSRHPQVRALLVERPAQD